MRFIVGLAALLTLTACDSKFKNCNTLIDGINVAVERIKKAEVNDADPKKMVEQFKNFAKIVKEESGRISKLEVKNEELATMRSDYVKMADDTVVAANKLIGAMDEMIAATTKAEQLQKDLDKTMGDLEKACTGATCIKVMKRIASTDASGDDEKLAAELKSLAADLAAMKTGKDNVDKAVAAHAAKTKELGDALTSMKSAEKKGDDAQKELDEVTNREDPLVNKINKFCGAS